MGIQLEPDGRIQLLLASVVPAEKQGGEAHLKDPGVYVVRQNDLSAVGEINQPSNQGVRENAGGYLLVDLQLQPQLSDLAIKTRRRRSVSARARNGVPAFHILPSPKSRQRDDN